MIELINKFSKQDEILHYLGKQNYLNKKEFEQVCNILDDKELILKFLTFHNFESVGNYMKKKQEKF